MGIFRRFSVTMCIAYFFTTYAGWAQTGLDEKQLGAWYMYFFNTGIKESRFGIQGDVQFRNWDFGNDLEQLLLRGGFSYVPKGTNVKFGIGYAFILIGKFGEDGNTSNEDRIHQEALLPQKVGGRIYLRHRFRFEERWIDGQDFRTRWRYTLFCNIPFNSKDLVKGTFYYAFYNEIFINGQRDIGNGIEVELFDRDRFYNAIGYGLNDKMRIQGGYMYQLTDNWGKGQIQLGLHHSF